MSTRRFCDRCNQQIDYKDFGQAHDFAQVEGRFRLQIAVAVDGKYNGGNLCRDCLAKIAAISIANEVAS